ncbi:NINE protein [Candidatus Woesearchaeota archaeon]|nr:NINE protein [Candidatus Woesearchaeota archaeon]
MIGRLAKAYQHISTRKKPKEVNEMKKVNWTLCLILSIVFGGLGVDRFIMGHIGLGILKLITFGGCGVWYIIDIILIATKHPFKDVQWVE